MGLSSKQVIGDSLGRSQERGLEIQRIAGETDSQYQQREKVAPLSCPRCDSKNTKFCYYNNYSKLQPRHFCKACRRYWTAGGVLRDVPVGGSRKNKRLKTAHDDDTNSCSSTTIAAGQHQQPPPLLMPLDACPAAILHETLLRTPTQLKLPFAPDCGALNASSYVESTPSAALLPPEYLAWEEEPAGILSYRFEDMFDPFSSSISSPSCSSPLDDCARRDSGLISINGGASSWQDLAGSYLSCWDEVFDIVDLELKLPGPEQKI